MGKRNVVVVYSSSDPEVDEIHSRSANCSSLSKSNKSKTKQSNRSRSSSGLKRSRRLSHSCSLLPREPNRADEINFDAFCEGFYEDLRESPGSLRSGKELWVDKYKPKSLEELAVPKKKVEEVKMWLEESMINSKEEFHNHSLVITGQAGVGKSATVRVLASHLGVELCEWNTPTPTLWQEHIHNSFSGVSYMSKLDEFETFVERIRKYSLLPLSSTGGSRAPYILLIDDLPLANGKVAYERMYKCLHVLARSTQIPTIILITEHSKVEPAENTTCHWENLQSCLETAGARKVAFNPVTLSATKKTLSRICQQEDCKVNAELIDLIAKTSVGDIRHAITSLQYCCLTANQMLFLSNSTPSGTHSKDRSYKSASSDGGVILPFGRDETLSLFHALGKFLHNKRETVHASRSGQEIFLLSERFVRLPLKMDAPENILCQAHGQTRSIIDFLHENVLDFISYEAINDAWDVTSYLSDADYLLAAFNGSTWSRPTGQHQLEKLSELAAASVAVRGVLFGNSHPSPSRICRWHMVRSPKLWPVEQSLRRNKNEMRRQGIEAYSNSRLYDMDIMATEYKPLLKWLGIRVSEGQKKMWSNMKEVYNSETTCSNDTEDQTQGENEDDDIEDW